MGHKNYSELKDIRPPEDVLASMAKQLTAEREKRATVLQAEGIKQSSILKAEGEKQSNILAAEGRLAAANRDAEARERLAAAEAMATKTVSMAIKDGNVQALNYFIAQKYVDAFASIGKSSNSRLVFMPMEASALISTISGIAELAKGAGAQSAVPSPQSTVPRVPTRIYCRHEPLGLGYWIAHYCNSRVALSWMLFDLDSSRRRYHGTSIVCI